MEAKQVEIAELRLLVESGAVRSASLEAVGRGLALKAATRTGEVILKAKAGGVRIFVNPVTAFNTLRALGISQASVSLEKWAPEQAAVM